MHPNGTQRRERPKAVGIWIRVSTEDQARGESPETHEARARMYAEMKGWQVVRVYDLAGVSGKSVMEHSEAKAMLADVKAGRIQALIFSKLARLARNTRELLEFAEYFQEHGADLVSLQESIDTSTPAGRFFYTLIAAMAQWEREEIAERVRESVKTRAQMGKTTGGAAPFGYRWEDKELVLDEQEAPVRVRMFELFREHRRVKTVARLLNEAGHRTRRGAKFSATTVRRLLTAPIAKGERRRFYTESLGEGKHWRLKPKEDWIYNEAPALVSVELWEEVNAVLQKRKSGRKPTRKARYLFSGLTYCACGTKMGKPTNMKKYYCRGCLNKIPEHDLELIFVEQLKAFFFNPEEITKQLEANDRALGEKQALLKSLEEERASVERKMDKVYQLYITGDLDPAGFGRRNRPLEERFQALALEAPRLQGEIDALKIGHLSVETVVSDAQTLYASWEHLSFEERRTVVETIVERITVGEAEVDIELAYVPVESGVAMRLPEKGSQSDASEHAVSFAPQTSTPPQVVVEGERMSTGSSKRRA